MKQNETENTELEKRIKVQKNNNKENRKQKD